MVDAPLGQWVGPAVVRRAFEREHEVVAFVIALTGMLRHGRSPLGCTRRFGTGAIAARSRERNAPISRIVPISGAGR